MRTTVNILLIVLVQWQITVFGQRIGFDEIDDSKVSRWLPEVTEEYQQIYHFGESEMESDFILLVTADKCYAQIKSGDFNDDATDWIWNYENLYNCRIEGNKFYSDKKNGEFVIYNNKQTLIYGLKIYDKQNDENGGYEIGTKSGSVTNHYSGEYPQASIYLLRNDELSQMTKSELKIMRNEIFARYGYIFRPGGAMENYFKKQKWYKSQHSDVNDFLTGLEKENIKLIQFYERK